MEKIDGIKYSDDNQPRELFLQSLADFRKKITSLDFWELPEEKRLWAFEALATDYVRTEHGEHLESDVTALEAARIEYEMRNRYMMLAALKKEEE